MIIVEVCFLSTHSYQSAGNSLYNYKDCIYKGFQGNVLASERILCKRNPCSSPQSLSFPQIPCTPNPCSYRSPSSTSGVNGFSPRFSKSSQSWRWAFSCSSFVRATNASKFSNTPEMLPVNVSAKQRLMRIPY